MFSHVAVCGLSSGRVTWSNGFTSKVRLVSDCFRQLSQFDSNLCRVGSSRLFIA